MANEPSNASWMSVLLLFSKLSLGMLNVYGTWHR